MKSIVFGVLVIVALVASGFTAICGLVNITENNKEYFGKYGWIYGIDRADSPFSYTEYVVMAEGRREVWKINFVFHKYEDYLDDDGDNKVDRILVHPLFGHELCLEKNKDGELFAKEFLRADLILLQTKLRFFDKEKEIMESSQGK